MFSTILILHQLLFGQFQNLQFGFKGGLNLANTDQEVVQFEEMTGTDFEKKVYPTYSVGAVIEYALSQKFSIVLNVLYNIKGAKFQGVQVEDFIGLIDYHFTEKIEYLSFPLLAKYHFGNASARPYVFLGPEISYLLNAETIIDAEAMVGVKFDTTITNTDELESLEVGMNAGLGVEFPVSSFKAFFEASYGLGLTNINNLEGGEDFKSRTIYLSAGILF
jgi:outer membrane protein W